MNQGREKFSGREKDIETVERELAERGYVIVEQEPLQNMIEYVGQKVRVPLLTGKNGRALLCRNYDDQWECVKNGSGEDFERKLRDIHAKAFGQ